MIDLTKVKSVLAEVDSLVKTLHGQDLDESKAVESQSKGRNRIERARLSQDLNLLAQRLELAAGLVKNEYWFARGEVDPLDRERGD